MMLLKTAVTSLLEGAEDSALYALRISDMRAVDSMRMYDRTSMRRRKVRCAASD